MTGEPRADDPEALAALRERLRELRFTGEGIADALGGDTLSRDPQDVPRYLRQLPEGSPLSPAVKLFLLDVAVGVAEAEEALAPAGLERLERMGVLVREEDSVRACVCVRRSTSWASSPRGRRLIPVAITPRSPSRSMSAAMCSR